VFPAAAAAARVQASLAADGRGGAGGLYSRKGSGGTAGTHLYADVACYLPNVGKWNSLTWQTGVVCCMVLLLCHPPVGGWVCRSKACGCDGACVFAAWLVDCRSCNMTCCHSNSFVQQHLLIVQSCATHRLVS
jgi:hypothetical protein